MSNVCLHSTDSSHHKHTYKVSTTSESTLFNRNFDKIVLESIDEGLSILGELVKQAIYIHLEENLNIKKQDIPDRIDHFAQSIEKIFGHSAKLIEIEIMKRLHEKIGDSFIHLPKQDDLEFGDYIRSVRLSNR